MTKTARAFTFIWLIAAALLAATHSEADQREKSQGESMQTTQPNIQGRRVSPDDVRKVAYDFLDRWLKGQ